MTCARVSNAQENNSFTVSFMHLKSKRELQGRLHECGRKQGQDCITS